MSDKQSKRTALTKNGDTRLEILKPGGVSAWTHIGHRIIQQVNHNDKKKRRLERENADMIHVLEQIRDGDMEDFADLEVCSFCDRYFIYIDDGSDKTYGERCGGPRDEGPGDCKVSSCGRPACLKKMILSTCGCRQGSDVVRYCTVHATHERLARCDYCP